MAKKPTEISERGAALKILPQLVRSITPAFWGMLKQAKGDDFHIQQCLNCKEITKVAP